MGNLVKGGDLMLFLGTKSIAFATSHTLSINAETTSIANKDIGGGDWDSQEAGLLSWSASSDNLYSTDGEGDNYSDLFDAMVNKTQLNAVFANKSQSTTDVPTGGWTAATTGYKGKVIVTSLELNAPNGEYATYTAQFTGIGALEPFSPTNP